MSPRRLVWAAGVVVLVFASLAAVIVASALPAGYDFHAYWLAGRNLLSGENLYPDARTILGLPDEFRYLPIVALVFVPFALLPYADALTIWIGIQLAIAAAVGVALIRPLPASWRPWAAAGYVFFLGLVLEVTLGNVKLISLALAVGALLMPDRTAEYVRFAPRLLEQDWVYAHIARPGPPELAAFFWSEWFPLALAVAAALVAVLAGVAARRDRARENTWHALTLATAGYLAPFGYFWTTFLILSLPLASDTLRRASATPRSVERAAVIGVVVLSWVLMEPQQTGTLVPILWHFVGVMLLSVTALLTLVRPAPVRLPLVRTPTRTA